VLIRWFKSRAGTLSGSGEFFRINNDSSFRMGWLTGFETGNQWAINEL
jgi:hypothetical protein